MRTVFPLLLSATLLVGCAPVRSSAAPAQVTPAPQTTPAATPAAVPSSEPTATPEPGLSYDEIRTPMCYDSVPARPCEGYFTMEQNGRWGLMRADGTELLPCLAPAPVSNCGSAGHWIWFPNAGAGDFSNYNDELLASGENALCPGHGGFSYSFFYNLDAPGLDAAAVDLKGLYCYRCSTPGDSSPMQDDLTADQLWDFYGDLLPVYSAHLEGEEGDPTWPGPLVESTRGDGAPIQWWYIGREGAAVLPSALEQAGWFFEEALAPVEMQGRWAYLDREGNLVTEAVYEPVCDSARDEYTGEMLPEPTWAAHLQHGYAAVCRDGKWGLLDATGAEVIPCEKEGVAWEGTTLWVKDNGIWCRTELPSA